MSYTFAQANEYLDSLLVFGIKLGLKNMQVLCTLLGNPENELKFVHVAGTNGKGSTCSMLAAAFKNCGFKTGLYTSPFLYRFTERWRINGIEVTEEDVAEAIEQIELLEPALVEAVGVRPTYFEVLTAVALIIFQKYSVDIVVWETGMGGRLDATNVVTPLTSIITNIDMDHTQYLGDSLLAIAGEKAGIIKNGIPVVIGEKKPALKVFFEGVALERNAQILQSGIDFQVVDLGLLEFSGAVSRRVRYTSDARQIELELSMAGLFQVENVGPVLATLELLADSIKFNLEKAVEGLEKAIWPGRMERRENGLILDGAHNPHAIRILVDSLCELMPGKKFHFICGILSDKECMTMLDLLLPVAASFYMVSIENNRASKPEDLRDYVVGKSGNVKGVGRLVDAIEEIQNPCQTVVLGSLYLIGEALELLNDGEALKIDKL